MSIDRIEEGDIVVCPGCNKEFEMKDMNEEEVNDFDRFFEHLTWCNEP